MRTSRVFNPDDYLWTPEGRIYTEERNAAAWEQMYVDLDAMLRLARPDTCLYVVMGVQGGGKTTWIQRNYEALGPSAVFMEAAVPARRHRERVLALPSALQYGVSLSGSTRRLTKPSRKTLSGPMTNSYPSSPFAVCSIYSRLRAMRKDSTK